jgi:hypothetical protein
VIARISAAILKEQEAAMKFLPVFSSTTTAQPLPGKAPRTPQESFSNIFSSELRALSQVPGSVKSGNTAHGTAVMVPGIVQLPVQTPQTAAAPVQGQVIKKGGAIDIASIVNFRTAGSKAVPTSDAIKVIGDNPSVVVSGKSQTQPQPGEWDRYKMDSSSSARKGNSSFLAGGVMVSFKIAVG